jgi:hypothetical protein
VSRYAIAAQLIARGKSDPFGHCLSVDSWEEELEAVDQSLAEEAVQKEIEREWRHHSVLGVLSKGHIAPSRKWTIHHREKLEERIGVPLSVRLPAAKSDLCLAFLASS